MSTMKTFLKVALFFVIIVPFILAKQINFFRKDYIYNETFDVFYKLHRNEWVSWDQAFLACDDEGAMLFYPKYKEELRMVKTIAVKEAKQHRDNTTDIFLGIHDKYSLGEFVSIDGEKDFSSYVTPSVSTSAKFPHSNCVLTNINELKDSLRVVPCTSLNLPQAPNFVCRKEYAIMCPTIDEDYKYIKSLKKCYKINQRRKTWEEAYHTCYMEGGQLIVIQDENEARFLGDYLRNQGNSYHVGTHRITPDGEMYTVKGEKITSVYHEERTREDDENRGDCGAIKVFSESSYNIKLISTNCHVKLPFICELV